MVERGKELSNGSSEFEAPHIEGGELTGGFTRPEHPLNAAPQVDAGQPAQQPAEAPKLDYDLSAVINGSEKITAPDLQSLMYQQMLENSQDSPEPLDDAA